MDLPVFGVVTFRRPEKLDRLLRSVRVYYAEAYVHVADNGIPLPCELDAVDEHTVSEHASRYDIMPYDAGLSACRNHLATATDSDLLILDDDFEFTDETNIEHLQAVLDSQPDIEIACGDAGCTKPLVFDEEGNTKLTDEQKTAYGVVFIPCDISDNFMLIRRSAFDKGLRWNPALKVGEHRRFFERAKELGINVAHVPSCRVKHERGGDTPEYDAARCRAVELNEPFRKPNDSRNIVVLGVGHSGTSIIVKMLHALGWNLGEAKPGVAESLAVQDVDKRLLAQHGICFCGSDDTQQAGDNGFNCRRCNSVVSSCVEPEPHEFAKALSDIKQPWVIKDPRMVATWERWKWILKSYEPLVLLVERDFERMRKTYAKYKFPGPRIYGHDVAELIEMARYHYAAWDGPKAKVRYEQVVEAAKQFDLDRAQK